MAMPLRTLLRWMRRLLRAESEARRAGTEAVDPAEGAVPPLPEEVAAARQAARVAMRRAGREEPPQEQSEG